MQPKKIFVDHFKKDQQQHGMGLNSIQEQLLDLKGQTERILEDIKNKRDKLDALKIKLDEIAKLDVEGDKIIRRKELFDAITALRDAIEPAKKEKLSEPIGPLLKKFNQAKVSISDQLDEALTMDEINNYEMPVWLLNASEQEQWRELQTFKGEKTEFARSAFDFKQRIKERFFVTHFSVGKAEEFLIDMKDKRIAFDFSAAEEDLRSIMKNPLVISAELNVLRELASEVLSKIKNRGLFSKNPTKEQSDAVAAVKTNMAIEVSFQDYASTSFFLVDEPLQKKKESEAEHKANIEIAQSIFWKVCNNLEKLSGYMTDEMAEKFKQLKKDALYAVVPDEGSRLTRKASTAAVSPPSPAKLTY